MDAAVLGAPVGAEGHWSSAGGGWVQQFEHGWAMVSDDGEGGMVDGALLPYFEANGYVNATGWPHSNAVTDSSGTYQYFGSQGDVISGALMSSASGTYRVKGGMLATYLGQGLRPVLGSPTGEEVRWSSGGGGWAQSFAGGWLLYKSSTVKGYIPNSFPWPDLNAIGWPTSGPSAACGSMRIAFERGSLLQNGGWCPASQYAQPVTGPIVSGPGRTMTYGMNGIKVYLAQQKLGGIPWAPMNSTVGPTTTAKLKAFQSAHGLPQTGNIDPATWAALGTGRSWDVDGWKQPSTVSTSATRAQRVNAMVAWAKAQVGKRYIWGSTGPDGFDCSGFLLQAMRAGGVDPKNVSNAMDTSTTSDLSWQMYQDPEFQGGSGSALQVGDFVYYGSPQKVKHVAMYIGGGTYAYVNAAGQSVQFTNNPSAGWGTFWGVNRAFAF